jgi:hypothetical protein
MTRIAELPPGKGYPFRFYIHDPWWLNSPWLDRYDREPHDIYLPLAVGRIDASGTTETPNAVEFLTVDNSYGQMPDKVPREVIPHILAAWEHKPDRPGPLVWVYPLSEYEQMVYGKESRLAEPYFGDWFIRSAINNALPLNTVVSSDAFVQTWTSQSQLYAQSVLITPMPDAGAPLVEPLLQAVAKGIRVLLYGPLDHADDRLVQALGLKRVSPISGELTVSSTLPLDVVGEGGLPKTLLHRPAYCAGGYDAILSGHGEEGVVAWVEQTGEKRVAALWTGEGRTLGWVRGTNSNHYNGGRLLEDDAPSAYFGGDLLMRSALAAVGFSVRIQKARSAQRNPVLTLARHANGFFLSGFNRDLTTDLLIRLPVGAPILVGVDAQLQEGAARYRLPRAAHRECRVFVEQQSGEVTCTEIYPGEIGVTRRFLVKGLKEATVRFFPEPDKAANVQFLQNPIDPYFEGDFLTAKIRGGYFGDCQEVGPVNGSLMISW